MPDYARACRPPDYAPNYAIMPSIMARALAGCMVAHGGRNRRNENETSEHIFEYLLRVKFCLSGIYALIFPQPAHSRGYSADPYHYRNPTPRRF